MKSISEILYAVTEDHGVYEVVRVDGTAQYLVVQTNIRTYEKAQEACQMWQKRELERNRQKSNMSFKISGAN